MNDTTNITELVKELQRFVSAIPEGMKPPYISHAVDSTGRLLIKHFPAVSTAFLANEERLQKYKQDAERMAEALYGLVNMTYRILGRCDKKSPKKFLKAVQTLSNLNYPYQPSDFQKDHAEE